MIARACTAPYNQHEKSAPSAPDSPTASRFRGRYRAVYRGCFGALKQWLPLCLFFFAAPIDIATGSSHSVKGDAPTGSHIPREVVKWTIPLDKTYEELNESELATVRSPYEGLSPAEDPPFPAEGMRNIAEKIYEAQKKLNVRGELFVVANIDAEGNVKGISVYSSPDKKMTQFAALLLMETKFKPGSCSGNPCDMEYLLNVVFE